MAAATQTELDILEAAINSGATRVKYQDREVEYRSLEEMMQIRDRMRAELGITSGTMRRIISQYDTGL